MYSFEGDFRRKPQQNLGGASSQRNQDRDALILQLQQQRQKREEFRKRLNSSIKIQAFVRSYLTRKHCKQYEREKFDNIFPKTNSDDLQLLSELVTKILFFFDDTKDFNRLIALSQLLLKQWRKVFQDSGSILQLRRLLSLHLRLLRANTEVSLAVPLRMFEVFTSTDSIEASLDCEYIVGNTLIYLINRGYFRDLCMLLTDKAPPLYGPSPDPPTPLCGALLDLIQRPLALINRVNIPQYDDTVLTEFAAAFLCNPYPEPVEMYILPALRQDVRQPFPFLPLIACLRDDSKFQSVKLVNDSWLLNSVLTLEPVDFVNEILQMDNTRLPNNQIAIEYLKVLAKLTVNVCNKEISYEFKDSLYSQETTADRDAESDSDEEPDTTTVRERNLLTKCIEMLNEPDRFVMRTCSQITETAFRDDFLDAMSEICHNMLLSHRMAMHNYRLLYTLAFKPMFIRGTWRRLTRMTHESSFGGNATPLLSAVSRGMDAALVPVHALIPHLAAFACLFNLLIGTLHDSEFCKDFEDNEEINPAGPCAAGGGRVHAFSFAELGALCRALRQLCLGLVELAYPESRAAAEPPAGAPRPPPRRGAPAWNHLLKVTTQLLRALYQRDGRLQFMGRDAWPVEGIVMEGAKPRKTILRVRTPLSRMGEGPPPTAKELRVEKILKEIPFVIPFDKRVKMFRKYLYKERIDNWYELMNFHDGPSITISVRRTHLYEDAFEKLSPENEPNLKLKVRVQLINLAGAEEPGVDGGGLFREFLSELLRSTFDPNRGLFRLNKDNMLYPNPAVHLLYDNFPMHYYFAGRMLGKAIYDQLLVELPLAEFFLSKLCSSREAGVHALASLDPALYRGLLLLKAHRRRDVPDLGLDFTVLTDDLGEQRVVELKPGGANIPVTAENRIEYIHLVADYKLNKQIRAQCNAFKQGLHSVVDEEWICMFSCRELQLVISGAEIAVDVADLKAHTHYSASFSADHHVIIWFWNVVENFTDSQRRQLLKFVTSCSRPPLLGFKELHPPFSIHPAGVSERLPSSSTCMNLLKLPEYPNQDVLRDKLLYALQAGAGFELS